MSWREHDDSERGHSAANWAATSGLGGVRRLRAWLWRTLGRRCATGLWTMSPDGKLNCESWSAEAGCRSSE
jgi:hypothetical protein